MFKIHVLIVVGCARNPADVCQRESLFRSPEKTKACPQQMFRAYRQPGLRVLSRTSALKCTHSWDSQCDTSDVAMLPSHPAGPLSRQPPCATRRLRLSHGRELPWRTDGHGAYPAVGKPHLRPDACRMQNLILPESVSRNPANVSYRSTDETRKDAAGEPAAQARPRASI